MSSTMLLYLDAQAKSEYIQARLAVTMRRGCLVPLISYAAHGSADSALEPILGKVCA